MNEAHHHHGLEGGWLNFPLGPVGRILAAALAVMTVLLVVGVALMWPSADDEGTGPLGQAVVDPVDATVIAVRSDVACASVPEGVDVRCDAVVFEIVSGPTDGELWTWEIDASSRFAPRFEVGDDVYLSTQPGVTDERFRYSFIDFDRESELGWLVVLFAVAIIALGGLQGVRALVSLGLSFLALAWFTLPAILDGASPVTVALIGSGVVAVVALITTHGLNHLSAVALLGSFAALGLTGGLAWLFVRVTNLSGIADENVRFLLVGRDAIDPRGLLLAGIVIGALGVLDDVTVTQAAAVSEIHRANPGYGARRLYSAALRVGRSHIASTTNTLVLAYAGASLPLLLLFTETELSIGQVASSELIAVEIVRTAVGTIGLVASVPVTTALAVWVVRGDAHAEDGDDREADDEDPGGASSADGPEVGRVTWDDFAPRERPM
ncbi:MAG: YibE/F family protein [Acidimicrobiales bacterium]